MAALAFMLKFDTIQDLDAFTTRFHNAKDQLDFNKIIAKPKAMVGHTDERSWERKHWHSIMNAANTKINIKNLEIEFNAIGEGAMDLFIDAHTILPGVPFKIIMDQFDGDLIIHEYKNGKLLDMYSTFGSIAY